MKSIFFALIMVMGLWACNTKPSDQTTDHDMADEHHDHPGIMGDARAAEVMAIHDSIMPRMEDIMRLKASLQKEIQQLDSLEKSATNTKKIAQAEALDQSLEQADQHMMGWMRQYSPDTLTQLNDAEAAAYLQIQKTRIESVKTAMQQAISNAEAFLKNSYQQTLICPEILDFITFLFSIAIGSRLSAVKFFPKTIFELIVTEYWLAYSSYKISRDKVNSFPDKLRRN